MSKTKIVWAAIAVGFAYDAYIAQKNRKKIEELREDKIRISRLCNVYASMLNNHGIRPDPFERIAIKTLIKN